MPFSIADNYGIDGFVRIRISGLFTVSDLLALQSLAKEKLEQAGSFRALVEMDGFQGWSREKGWDKTSWMPQETHPLMRMALVGDGEWKEDAMMFTGQPMRKDTIEFFTKDRLAEARAWLERPL